MTGTRGSGLAWSVDNVESFIRTTIVAGRLDTNDRRQVADALLFLAEHDQDLLLHALLSIRPSAPPQYWVRSRGVGSSEAGGATRFGSAGEAVRRSAALAAGGETVELLAVDPDHGEWELLTSSGDQPLEFRLPAPGAGQGPAKAWANRLHDWATSIEGSISPADGAGVPLDEWQPAVEEAIAAPIPAAPPPNAGTEPAETVALPAESSPQTSPAPLYPPPNTPPSLPSAIEVSLDDPTDIVERLWATIEDHLVPVIARRVDAAVAASAQATADAVMAGIAEAVAGREPPDITDALAKAIRDEFAEHEASQQAAAPAAAAAMKSELAEQLAQVVNDAFEQREKFDEAAAVVSARAMQRAAGDLKDVAVRVTDLVERIERELDYESAGYEAHVSPAAGPQSHLPGVP